MAIPTVLRETDYAAVDFTNKAQGTFEVLRDALITQLGWNLEFEDLVSADQSFVVSNNGTGNCMKLIKEESSTLYLRIQLAQSWSDINTEVSLQRDYLINVQTMGNFFYIVGDSKRFYLTYYGSQSSYTSDNPVTLFVGDCIAYNENDPNVFVGTPHYPSPSLVIPQPPNVSTYSGVLTQYLAPALSNVVSDYVLLPDNTNVELLAPGTIAPIMTTPSQYGIPNMTPASSPIIMSECYLSYFDNVNKVRSIVGKFPGLAISVNFSEKVTGGDRGALITLAGEQCVTLPSKDYFNIGVIRLSDWELM